MSHRPERPTETLPFCPGNHLPFLAGYSAWVVCVHFSLITGTQNQHQPSPYTVGLHTNFIYFTSLHFSHFPLYLEFPDLTEHSNLHLREAASHFGLTVGHCAFPVSPNSPTHSYQASNAYTAHVHWEIFLRDLHLKFKNCFNVV